MKNWKVIYYNKKNNEISSHIIKDRTEHEAENEAMADMPRNCNDWTMTEIFQVNKENALTADKFEHITIKNADKTPARCRRNGKTKTWKTRPEEFKIPVKYGLKDCFYIDQNNCHEWLVV